MHLSDAATRRALRATATSRGGTVAALRRRWREGHRQAQGSIGLDGTGNGAIAGTALTMEEGPEIPTVAEPPRCTSNRASRWGSDRVRLRFGGSGEKDERARSAVNAGRRQRRPGVTRVSEHAAASQGEVAGAPREVGQPAAPERARRGVSARRYPLVAVVREKGFEGWESRRGEACRARRKRRSGSVETRRTPGSAPAATCRQPAEGQSAEAVKTAWAARGRERESAGNEWQPRPRSTRKCARAHGDVEPGAAS